MNTIHDFKKGRVLKTLFAVIILTLVILFILLIQQYQRIQQLNNMIRHQTSFGMLHGTRLLTSADASSTQAWMTFEYINRVFALPPQYLKETLFITDSHYPRITIAGYARSAKIPETVALLNVQNTIRNTPTLTATSTNTNATTSTPNH